MRENDFLNLADTLVWHMKLKPFILISIACFATTCMVAEDAGMFRTHVLQQGLFTNAYQCHACN